MSQKILVINSGSATLKFKVFVLPNLQEESQGIVERIGISNSFLDFKYGKKAIHLDFKSGIKNHHEALGEAIKALGSELKEIKFVGHRVVHGGNIFYKTTQVNAKTLDQVKKISYLAPLHNPANIMGIEAAIKALPLAKQFMVFDTAYYRTIPDYAALYPISQKLIDAGIRKYGFHGISHKYSTQTAIAEYKLKKSKIISCHLGSGCSITASINGEAVETSMGFTPMSGLMMSTRVGDLDASAVLFMINELKLAPAEIDELLNKKSGLFAVAGTMDMREILFAAGEKVVGYKASKKYNAQEKTQAKLALKMFIYRIVKYIGEYYAIMKGLDLIVFTGGVGERSPAIRQMILAEIKHLPKFKNVVIPANEELMIAREVMGNK